MSDATPAKMNMRPARASLSWVWLVPLLALAVSLFVAWQSYAQRGKLIDIIFQSAEGITAGETVLKFRDVEVGRVEKVSLTADLFDVVVSVRVQKDYAEFIDKDATFWLVQPDVSLRGVTGLETVLSGVFIEGSWDATFTEEAYEFYAEVAAPLSTLDALGTSIVLLMRDGSSIAAGAPILHKGIKVGFLEEPELTLDEPGVRVNGFINFPYDRNLTTATRFWDTSGFSISLGTSGVELDVDSLASLIEGGVAFDTVVSGGEPVSNGFEFGLFSDEGAARDSVFTNPKTPVIKVAVLFDGSVKGLTKGSQVQFQGIRVGQVSDLNAVVDDSDDVSTVQLRAVLQIETGRLGMTTDVSDKDAIGLLSDLVSQGLRARLSTQNILSGSLVVELHQDDTLPPGRLDPSQLPYPTIPTTEDAISDVAQTTEDVLARIENLPIEELMQGAIDLMASVERLTNDENTRAIPSDVAGLIGDARALVSSDDIQQITPNLLATISDLDILVKSFSEAQLAEGFANALATTSNAAQNVASGTKNLPQISDELEALIANINALELAALVAEATGTLERVDTLFASDAVAGLPASVETTLADARSVLAGTQAFISSEDLTALPTDLRATIAMINSVAAEIGEANVAEQLVSAIESANNAAKSIETASDGLPKFVEELDKLATSANELALDELVASATQTLESIDGLVGAEGMDELPQNLNTSVAEIERLLADLRHGGAIENLNLALTSAAEAARAIETAADALPQLAARADALVRQTQSIVEDYSERSRFNTETLATLRDIQEAADAISSLARTIQRNPSSLLIGR